MADKHPYASWRLWCHVSRLPMLTCGLHADAHATRATLKRFLGCSDSSTAMEERAGRQAGTSPAARRAPRQPPRQPAAAAAARPSRGGAPAPAPVWRSSSRPRRAPRPCDPCRSPCNTPIYPLFPSHAGNLGMPPCCRHPASRTLPAESHICCYDTHSQVPACSVGCHLCCHCPDRTEYGSRNRDGMQACKPACKVLHAHRACSSCQAA